MFDFLNPTPASAAPTSDAISNNPFSRFLMPTAGQKAMVAPAQQGVNPDTQALIDALRNGQQGGRQPAPAQGGNVTSAGYFGQGMDTKAIGNAMAPMFNPSTPTPQPWTDANTFGTGSNWSPV